MKGVELVPYRREHVLPLLDQRINAGLRDSYRAGIAEHLEKYPGASVFGPSGDALVCGGVIPMWHGRGYVWTVFNEQSKRCFVPVFRAIKRFLELELVNYPRLEIAVPCHFTPGRRRAELLGFHLETECARHFLPSGEDASIYVMLKEGA